MTRGLTLLTLLFVPVVCGSTPEKVEVSLRQSLAHFLTDESDIERLMKVVDGESAKLTKRLRRIGGKKSEEKIRKLAVDLIVRNLQDKIVLSNAGPELPMSARDIERTVIGYELFKLETYVTSGVFPKRYFGYFDGKYDTVELERRLRQATIQAVKVINAYQKERKTPLRVNHAEVAVTFIAEGGALWLGAHKDRADKLHPVLDAGLDDLASGFSDLPGLMEKMDRELGTGLSKLVAWVEPGAPLPAPTVVPQEARWLRGPHGEKGPHPYLVRFMTLEEAVAGTALMWLWEKKIAAREMLRTGAGPIEGRPLDEQFIIGSLVYNSGILHDPGRWKMIKDFSSGEWISRTSERNAKRRSRLNVLAPKQALQDLIEKGDYPDQPTAWMAGYHVLQRYGAWAALMKFTDVFDSEGMFGNPPDETGEK